MSKAYGMSPFINRPLINSFNKTVQKEIFKQKPATGGRILLYSVNATTSTPVNIPQLSF